MADAIGGTGAVTWLVLVRHGEAVCSVDGFYGGDLGCQGLTGLGREQAARLRDFCAQSGELSRPADVLYSPLRRARETAAIVLAGLRPARVRMHRGLRELDCGAADGLSRGEARRRFGRHSGVAAAPRTRLAPGAESWVEMIERASGALHGIVRAAPSGVVIAFTHFGVISASLTAFGDRPAGCPPSDEDVPLASMTVWAWDTGGAPRLEVMGDAGYQSAQSALSRKAGC
jgi:2,3-bisphosphoglycerate-dependent phosphoglycerate mutase